MNLSKLFGAVISGLLVTLFYGGALLLLLFFGLMGAFPLYVTQALLVFGPATLLAAILWGSGCLGAGKTVSMLWGLGGVCRVRGLDRRGTLAGQPGHGGRPGVAAAGL